MEIDAMLRKKLKLRKKLMVLRDILLVLLASLFIIIAFIYTVDVNNAIGDGMKNIRYGLFSFALVISGTSIIIAVYLGRKKQIFKMFQQKSGLPPRSKK
jgi:TRAP-type C4-dicarboxylate transport system permease small subunit